MYTKTSWVLMKPADQDPQLLINMMNEGLDGGGVWYSLLIKKFSPLFISLKFWVIH